MCKANITLEDVLPRKIIQMHKDKCGMIWRSNDQHGGHQRLDLRANGAMAARG